MATPNPTENSTLSQVVRDTNALIAYFEEELPREAAALPFDLIPSTPIGMEAERISVAGIEMPKLYGMSQGETMILADIFERFGKDASDLTLMQSYKIAVATTLLMFRRTSGWKVKESINLTQAQLDAIYAYYTSESLGWADPEADPEKDKPEEQTQKKAKSRSGKTPTSD